MNSEKLHDIINRYENNLYFTNDAANNEIFKWKAVKCFQNVWFGNKQYNNFHDLIKEAFSESSVLIDNSITHPANGIIAMAEKEPETVENLFRNVLFADDGGNINIRQNNAEKFVEEYNLLCEKLFPKSYKYKQDMHSAICYLSLYAPEENFIYKYTPAKTFAEEVEYGRYIGSGSNFSLEDYYDLCKKIVLALREHGSLLDKHSALLSDEHYKDESLHLMAFDVIYCYSVYFIAQIIEEKHEAREADILRKKNEIRETEEFIESCKEVNLISVHVSHKKFGDGVIVNREGEEINNLFIDFSGRIIHFIIKKNLPQRPIFEDDESIMKLFDNYDAARAKRKNLLSELKKLESENV